MHIMPINQIETTVVRFLIFLDQAGERSIQSLSSRLYLVFHRTRNVTGKYNFWFELEKVLPVISGKSSRAGLFFPFTNSS